MAKINYSTSMFIGETTRGVSLPVFFDAHTPIFNNKPPGILITGQPGSGKSFLAMTLATISGILGKTTIVLDPKGDFLALMNLTNEIGKINLWNLDGKQKGALDPFYMAEDAGERLNLVISVISMLIGGIPDEQFTVLSPIVKDVIEEDNPSLLRVVETLNMSPKAAGRALGANLDLIRRLPFAQLCFAPGNKRRSSVNINTGFTVVTMVGLELTPNKDLSSGTMGNSARLASTVFFLVTDFIRRIMNNDDSPNPKTLIIDEAWAVLSSQAGADCVKAVARLGRSKKLALILVTQNNKDIELLDIENTITTRFSFRTDSKEATAIVSDMQLPEGEGFESLFTALGAGECVMRDWLGRYSTVQISNWKQDWAKAFETNPLLKEKARREKEALQRAKSGAV